MDKVNGAAGSARDQIQTRQTIKRKEKEAEETLKSKREKKRRRNAFQRSDKAIRPNDIICDTQLKKIKVESVETHSPFATVKVETKVQETWNGNSNEIVETVECEVSAVKEEVDIPNDDQGEMLTFDNLSSASNEDSVEDQSMTSTPSETGLQAEDTNDANELTNKVKALGNLLAVSTKQKDEMKEQLLKNDEEIQNLKRCVGELESREERLAESGSGDALRNGSLPLPSSLSQMFANTIGNVELLEQLQSGSELSKADIASITRSNSTVFNILMKELVGRLVSQFIVPQQQLGAKERETVIKQVMKHCTPKDFMDMCKANTANNIGQIKLLRDTIAPTYEHYIFRKLSRRPRINSRLVLTECPDVFVFKSVGQLDLVRLGSFIKSEQTATSESYLNDVNCTSRFIILNADTHWEEICKQRKAPAHLINCEREEWETNYFLEETTGDSPIMMRYLRHSHMTEEDDENMDVTITEQEFIREVAENSDKRKGYCICDSPGMGKTLLLENLARNIANRFPERVVAVVRLDELMQKVESKGDQTEASKVILEYLSTCPMAKLILTELFNAEILHLELFLDGLDEIAQKYIPERVQHCLSLLKHMPNTRLYVTSGPHLRHWLQKILGVVSFDILPLRIEEMKHFLLSFWYEKDSSQDSVRLSEFADFCIKKFERRRSEIERQITGTPLQCRILAKVFAKQANIYSNSKEKVSPKQLFKVEMSLAQIYREYVEGSLEECRELANEPDGYTQVRNYHTWIALKTVFPKIADFFAQEFEVDTTQSTAEINPIIFSAGLLEKRLRGSVETIKFVHRAFAEFIASHFFVEALEEEARGSRWSPIFRKSVIRFLFVNVLAAEVKVYGKEKNRRSYISASDYWISCRPPTFKYPTAVYFLNHALSEKAPTWFSSSKVVNGCVPLRFSFHNRLLMCLHENYIGIFRLCSMYMPLKERLDDPTKAWFVKNAAQYSSVSLLEALCSFLSDRFQYDAFNNADRYGCNPLQAAVTRGDYEVAKYFIDKLHVPKGNLIAACVCNSLYESAAAVERRIDICNLLVDKNPNILEEFKDNDNYSALESPHMRLINWMISKGIHPISPAWNHNITFLDTLSRNANDDEFQKACSLLSENVHDGSSKAFVEKVEEWRSGLHYILALRRMELDKIKLIVGYCDRDRIADEDFINMLLLTALGRNQSQEILDFLFQYHPNFSQLPKEAKNAISYLRLLRIDSTPLKEYGLSFLHLASDNYGPEEYHEIVSFLHSQGHTQLFHIQELFGKLPIHRAIRSMEVKQETLMLFLNNGVDINIRKGQSNFAFLMSAVRGNRSVAFLKTLIEMGADIYKKQSRRPSFIDFLRKRYSDKYYNEIMRYLKEKGKITE